jgi:hypothetical protein
MDIHAKEQYGGIPAHKLPYGLTIKVTDFEKGELWNEPGMNDKIIGVTDAGEHVRYWFRHFLNFSVLEGLRSTSRFFEELSDHQGGDTFPLPDTLEVVGVSGRNCILRLTFVDDDVQEFYLNHVAFRTR